MTDPLFDPRFMELAFRIAERQLGRTGENPAVGCVIVRNGQVLGIGATADGGRPHAEQIALSQIPDATGASAYVTLEPCAHFGKTPPCANALIDAKISHIICPFQDPDPRVAGRGFEILRRAGIEIIHPHVSKIPSALRPFFTARILGRPHVTLKMATSIDGKIALKNGQSKWISSEASRNHTRIMRSKFDAIMVGIGTVLADDPSLDIRVEGFEKYAPRPIILDRNCRTPLDAKILSKYPVIFHDEKITPSYELLERAQCIAISTQGSDLLPLTEITQILCNNGYNSVLIEGGASLGASAMKAGIVDQIIHVAANAIIGGDGLSAILDLGLDNMDHVHRFELQNSQIIGHDLICEYAQEHLDISAIIAK